MVVTQGVRNDGPVASNIRLKTKPEGRYRICFRLTKADDVQVDVVNGEGELIRSLADEHLEGGDEAHCYDWDGRTDGGQEATPGIYRARLTLDQAERVATSGERLRVHSEP
jgi:flagellar hook assembly protein FlgD